MSKRRMPRETLGVVVREDGVRAEVKNPTVWNQLQVQQAALEHARELLERQAHELMGVQALAARRGELFDRLWAHPWLKLGARLGLLRIDVTKERGELVRDVTPGDTDLVSDSARELIEQGAPAAAEPAVAT